MCSAKFSSILFVFGLACVLKSVWANVKKPGFIATQNLETENLGDGGTNLVLNSTKHRRTGSHEHHFEWPEANASTLRALEGVASEKTFQKGLFVSSPLRSNAVLSPIYNGDFDRQLGDSVSFRHPRIISSQRLKMAFQPFRKVSDEKSLTPFNLTMPLNLTYGAGDISSYHASLLQPTTLQQFNGVWRLIGAKSDSLENILSALGVSALKRRIMANYEGTTEILVEPDGSSVYMRNILPAGKVVAGRVLLNGEAFRYEDSDTGTWISRAEFTKNRLVQVRYSRLGTMYDIRVVFPTDPDKHYRSPMLLFKWSFTPVASPETTYTVDRWLKLVTSTPSGDLMEQKSMS